MRNSGKDDIFVDAICHRNHRRAEGEYFTAVGSPTPPRISFYHKSVHYVQNRFRVQSAGLRKPRTLTDSELKEVKQLPLAQARANLPGLVQFARFRHKVTVITLHGKPAAAVGPVPQKAGSSSKKRVASAAASSRGRIAG